MTSTTPPEDVGTTSLPAAPDAAPDEAPENPPRDAAGRIDELILGGPRLYDFDDLLALTGASAEFVDDYWRWLGLPVNDHHEARFTAADVESLREILDLSERGQLDAQAQMTLVRSLGHTADRLALWQVEAFVEHLTRRFDLDDVAARQATLDQVPRFADVLARQIDHAWRRQLAALMGRFATELRGVDGSELAPGQLPLRRAVGFADIVSFTKRTAGLGSQELSEYVQAFESRARDVIVGAGGRVVKTIGDAVLFVADDVVTGAEVALGLAAPHVTAEEIPVRVGFVWGRVLSRFGDVFGSDVNLASRITELAEPSTVLVDPTTAALLSSSARYALTAQTPQSVQGLGEIQPVRLQRAYTG